MKAAVFAANNEPLIIEELKLDRPGPSEIHVKWSASGVCHSDVSIWNGTLPLPAPSVLGHEGAGVVVEAGQNRWGFKKGDHVVGSFVPACGECFYCKHDQSFVCAKSIEIGMGRMPFTRPDGSRVMGAVGGLATFAEETIVHEAAIVKIPSDFPLDQAALIGCGVTTGVGSVLFAAKVKPGSTVAIIGCGGVGLAAVQGCRIAGADKIIAIDLNPSKRKAAEEFGATDSFDPAESDPVNKVKEMTGGRGADYAFEVVGNTKLQRQAYDMTRPGGVCCWVGIPNMMEEVSIPAAMIALENKSIVGTLYGSANVRTDMVKFVELAKKGDLDLEKMVSRKIKLGEINDAFRAMLEGEVIRSVIMYDA